MDPKANLARQRELAIEIDAMSASGTLSRHDSENPDANVTIWGLAQELAELVAALDEWRTNGGFDPYLPEVEWPTHAQATALRRVLQTWVGDRKSAATVTRSGAGLPDDYVYVRFTDGFECGIATDGAVSS